MATASQPTTIRDTPVTLTLPELDGTEIEAPATAAAIANYNAMLARLAEADAALEAADASLRAAKDAFLNASAVAIRYRADLPDREALTDAEQRGRDARQYRAVVRRALDDAAGDVVVAVRTERAGALDALQRQLMNVRHEEADAIEQLARLRARRAELHAIHRWMAAFPGTSGHVMQYRAGTAGRLLDLVSATGEPLGADAVLDALRADTAR